MMEPDHPDELNRLVGKSLGQFSIVERIGSGGLTAVFKAYQPAIDRYVAIKVLPSSSTNDPMFSRRFAQETRLIAKLAHPNIVQIHDFGQQDDISYIAMEYVEGGALKQRIAKKALPVPEAADFILQAAQGLSHAHRNGIIHRDVKPANMLLRKNDHLLLTDFGITKILESSSHINRVAVGIGTPQYMSPEQGTGQAVDARSDIYSLGIVFFHCLTGHVPFTAESPLAITVRHLQDPLPIEAFAPKGVPDPIVRVVTKMTAKRPQERYQSMDGVIDALALALTSSNLTLPRLGWAAPTYPGTSLPSASAPPYPASPYTGTPIAESRICFRCGTTNPGQRLYCMNCGDDLSNKRASADRYLGHDGYPILARFSIQSGLMSGRSYRFHQDVTTIGRTNGNDLVLPGRTVSRRHARLWFDKGKWYLEDLQSANGTFVNGIQIYKPVVLQNGDRIQFGDEVVIFQSVSGGSSTEGGIGHEQPSWQIKEMPSSKDEKAMTVQDAQKQLSLVAIASIELEENDFAFVGKTYSIKADIAPNKAEASPELLNVHAEAMPFDVLLHHSEEITLITPWAIRLSYNPHNPEPQMIEYVFQTVAPGNTTLMISFYHQRRWLKTIRLELKVIDEPAYAATGSER